MPDGNLEYLGRLDQQVKIRGFRVEVEEIEKTLIRHPAVKEAVVAARQSGVGDNRLVAYFVLQDSSANYSSEIRDYLRISLPEYMVPHSYVAVEALPLTFNGKIDRRALAAISNERPLPVQTYVAPKNDVESKLKLVWEELLEIKPIGMRDNFFELGGDSLLATQMLIQIEEIFAKILPPSCLIQNATIEHLAKTIVSPTSNGHSSLVAIQPSGSKPPLFFVHSLGGEVLGYRSLVPYLSPDQPFYGLRAAGLDGLATPLTDVSAIATNYVKEISSVQSEGPFFLGGHSSGGIIAFEMAQQLLETGQKVAFLGILDEDAPELTTETEWSVGHLLDFGHNLPYWFVDHVAKRPLREVVRDIRRHMVRIAKVLMNQAIRSEAFSTNVHDAVDLSELSEYSSKIAKAHYEALTNYRPRTYPGRVYLYRTRSEPLFHSHILDKGWGKLALGGVDVVVVPGNHQNIIQEPYAKVVGHEMKVALEQLSNHF